MSKLSCSGLVWEKGKVVKIASLRVGLMVWVTFCSISSGRADVHGWNPAGSAGEWSKPDNWEPPRAPPHGEDDLYIAKDGGSTCIYDAGGDGDVDMDDLGEARRRWEELMGLPE